MATTFLVAPLTVLCTVGFQNSSGRSIVGSRNIAASETNLKNETYKSNRNFRTNLRNHNLSKKDKLILRRVKNTEAAKASREKAKLHQKFLEERLSDLQYEKMKLLLEKEALSKQHMELQKENLDLKSNVQNMNSLHMKEESSCEATIRHASFVNILLQKEWVVSKIFIILFATTWKAINLSFVSPSVIHFRDLKSIHKVTKFLTQLLCHAWTLMIPLTGFSHSFLLLNG